MQHPENSQILDWKIEPSGSDEILPLIFRAARLQFADAPGSHDWEHTLRVLRLCRRIGPAEGADMLVLEAAALLHDIARPLQDAANGSVCHAVQGAAMAGRIISGLPLTAERRENIIHSVRSHRFRDRHSPESIEAKVLFDADKLDAIGAVGVARAYLFAGELGACLHNPDLPPEQAEAYSRNDTGHREFSVKLLKIKDCMLTAEGRRMARDRHAFMVTFFNRFLEEFDGRC
jgi:uncharacterized protein